MKTNQLQKQEGKKENGKDLIIYSPTHDYLSIPRRLSTTILSRGAALILVFCRGERL